MLVEVAATLASGSATGPLSPLHPARAPATISSKPRRPFMVRVCGLVIAGCPRVALIIADQPRLVALSCPCDGRTQCVRPAKKQRRARPAAARARKRVNLRSASAAEAGAHRLGLARDQALTLRPLARELASAADRLRPLTCLLLRWLLVVPAKLHFAENALALHLLLQRLEGLVDIVVADENLHASFLFDRAPESSLGKIQ